MIRGWSAAVLLGAVMISASAAEARQPYASRSGGEKPEYAVDAITVVAPERDLHNPLALCIVWADAEGLGVGPQQLGGLHGLSLTLDLSTPAATALDQALASARAGYPGAPDWLLTAIRTRAARIAQVCGATHPDPVLIAKLTSRDRR